MRFDKIIESILRESDAADQAHELGLIYGGYGRWKDPETGQVVAKTIAGRLVRVPAAENPDSKWNSYIPTEDDVQREPRWKSKRSWKAGDERYRNPKFYDSKVKDAHFEFLSVLKRGVAVEALPDALAEVLDVSPEVTYHLNSPECDKIHAFVGSEVAGLYDPKNRRVHISKKSSAGLARLSTTTAEDIEAYMTGVMWKTNVMRASEISEAIDGLLVIVHEMTHAKDHYLAKHWSSGGVAITEEDHRDHSFILEGLTENKARESTVSLLTKKRMSASESDVKIINPMAYGREVASMRALEQMKPGVLSVLWEQDSMQARKDTINQTLREYCEQRLASFKVGNENDKGRIEAMREMIKEMSAGNADYFVMLKQGLFNPGMGMFKDTSDDTFFNFNRMSNAYKKVTGKTWVNHT